MRWTCRIASAVCVLTLTPSTAAGAEVSIGDFQLRFVAPDRETNIVDITINGLAYDVVDARAPLRAGPGCTAETQHYVRCSGLVFGVRADLGTGNDDLIAAEVGFPVDVQGGLGDDFVVGGKQADSIAGGSGDDTLDGSTGEDRLIGEDGSDAAIGGDDADLLDGGPGGDYLRGRDGDDVALGGPGDDLAAGGAGDDTLNGQSGATVSSTASGATGSRAGLTTTSLARAENSRRPWTAASGATGWPPAASQRAPDAIRRPPAFRTHGGGRRIAMVASQRLRAATSSIFARRHWMS